MPSAPDSPLSDPSAQVRASVQWRPLAFGALVVLCSAVAVAYVLRARSAAPGVRGPAAITLTQVAVPSVLFVNKTLDAFGVVGADSGADAERSVSALRCDRMHFAGGRGVCLTANRGVFTTYRAVFFGTDLAAAGMVPLPGIPSRTRVSPDGSMAATTVFVSGHSYAPGTFSTETSLWNLTDGSRVATLEQFNVERDGKPFRAADFNYWGVTFARDGRRFYATLATAGIPYLVEGDLQARTARVIHARAECPSLSPDNRRLVFKRLNGRNGWQLHLFDLATLTETPLVAETRNVDDQVEWLDDHHVLYTLSDAPGSATPGENIWVLPISGGPARVFATRASSPAVLR